MALSHTKVVYQVNEHQHVNHKKITWLIYTVLVALLPIGIRLLLWTLLQDRSIELFNAGDFIAFGLILHIANINEIEHRHDSDKSWKTVHNGISIMFIIWYAILFTGYLVSEATTGIINTDATRFVAMATSVISFALSYSIYNRISKIPEAAD